MRSPPAPRASPRAATKDHDLGKLYWTRGLLYWDRKDYDRAIADETEAIKLDPKYVASLHRSRPPRIARRRHRPRHERIFSAAIRLNPKETRAYRTPLLDTRYRRPRIAGGTG